MKTILSFGLAAGVSGLLPTAAAQPAASDSPPLRHDSAFADYKPWRDIAPLEWRKVNDAVREAASQGGHAGHGSAAAASASAPSSKPATTQPEPAHRHHGGTK